MNRTVIDFAKYDRIFAFGCSFTMYAWVTWADILNNKYKNVKNLGHVGAGNFYIFNHIIEENLKENFITNDLIMICWSSVLREDRFVDGEWLTPGNLWTQQTYPKEFVKKYCDPYGMLKRDLTYITAAMGYLDNLSCDHIHFSMADIDLEDQYRSVKIKSDVLDLHSSTIERLYPSMYDVIWANDIGRICEERDDTHPLTYEHRKYLKEVFGYED